ncbi:MAG: hypothetical protein BHV99_00260 [Clostridium sp. 26_21]|nr:MAG: hypothetical protein BHV99_00260 [Clostridium sp. 26_21]
MCGICEKESRNSLCFECRKKIQREFKFITIYSKKQNFSEQYYLFQYKNLIRNLILQIKFQRKPYIYKTIEYFLQNNKKYLEKLKKYDIIIVVPLSWKRSLQRGYNQSLLIAKIISNILQIKIENKVLYKNKNIVPQSTLSKREREKNIKRAFKIKDIEKVKNKKILIIDDIYTTGSTLNECAKLLLKSGIKKENIGVLTLAKD